jgi:hypothetical protein
MATRTGTGGMWGPVIVMLEDADCSAMNLTLSQPAPLTPAGIGSCKAKISWEPGPMGWAAAQLSS